MCICMWSIAEYFHICETQPVVMAAEAPKALGPQLSVAAVKAYFEAQSTDSDVERERQRQFSYIAQKWPAAISGVELWYMDKGDITNMCNEANMSLVQRMMVVAAIATAKDEAESFPSLPRGEPHHPVFWLPPPILFSAPFMTSPWTSPPHFSIVSVLTHTHALKNVLFSQNVPRGYKYRCGLGGFYRVKWGVGYLDSQCWYQLSPRPAQLLQCWLPAPDADKACRSTLPAD